MKINDYYLPGSVSPEELTHLTNISQLSENIIVEIGSFQGRSTIGLAQGSKRGKGFNVYAIDSWSGVKVNQTKDVFITKESFQKNIDDAEVSDIVVPIQGTSKDVLLNWDKKIGMLFIDGDHSYNGVKEDIKWSEYVIPGGYILFHDYLSPNYDNSVIKAVNESKHNWTFHSQINSLIVFTK